VYLVVASGIDRMSLRVATLFAPVHATLESITISYNFPPRQTVASPGFVARRGKD